MESIVKQLGLSVKFNSSSEEVMHPLKAS